jgi:hypothetical protein
MPEIPANAPVPQDHKKPAAQLEAEGAEEVTIEYGGRSYVMPASLDEADGDVIDALDDQHVSYVLQALLGKDQWKAFKKTKPKVRDYNDLFSVYAEQIGLDTTGE